MTTFRINIAEKLNAAQPIAIKPPKAEYKPVKATLTEDDKDAALDAARTLGFQKP